MDIAGGCSGNLVGSDEQSEYLLRIDLGDGEDHCTHQQEEVNSLIEDASDCFVVAFSVTAGHQNLRTDREAETDHENGQIVYSGNG